MRVGTGTEDVSSVSFLLILSVLLNMDQHFLSLAQNVTQLLPAIGGPERIAIPAKKLASPINLCTMACPERSTCRD